MPKGSCMIEKGNDGDREEQNKPNKAWWTDTKAEETYALMTKYNSLQRLPVNTDDLFTVRHTGSQTQMR